MFVSLIPHVGRHCITGAMVEHNQDWIEIDGRRVGLIGRQPRAKILFNVPVGQSEIDAVRQFIADQRGEMPEVGGIVPAVVLSPEELEEAGL
jgi:hypothetical protein